MPSFLLWTYEPNWHAQVQVSKKVFWKRNTFFSLMNVGDKDDDLQKEGYTASKIYKNVHHIDAQNTISMIFFHSFHFWKKTAKTTFIVETN